jgi:plasmid stability protein
MATLTLRGYDADLEKALKETSARRGISVNHLILDTLRDALLGNGKKPRRYDDLDSLAGTWSVAEAEEFDAAVEDFEKIDGELWNGKA